MLANCIHQFVITQDENKFNEQLEYFISNKVKVDSFFIEEIINFYYLPPKFISSLNAIINITWNVKKRRKCT